MEIINHLISLVGDYALKPSLFSLIVIGILNKFQKVKINQTQKKIFQYFFLSYGAVVFVFYLITIIIQNEESETYQFLNRVTGSYFFIYILLLSTHVLSPLLTFLKKNLFILLTIAVLMNLAWLFESYVIHTTSLHRDYLTTNSIVWTNLLPSTKELTVILIGTVYGLVIYFATKKTNKLKSTTVLDN